MVHTVLRVIQIRIRLLRFRMDLNKERRTWFLSVSFPSQAIAAMQSISISNGPGQAGTLTKILAGGSFEKNRT